MRETAKLKNDRPALAPHFIESDAAGGSQLESPVANQATIDHCDNKEMPTDRKYRTQTLEWDDSLGQQSPKGESIGDDRTVNSQKNDLPGVRHERCASLKIYEIKSADESTITVNCNQSHQSQQNYLNKKHDHADVRISSSCKNKNGHSITRNVTDKGHVTL